VSLETGVCRSSARGAEISAVPSPQKFVARTRDGGEGRLQWKTKTQENFPKSGQTVTYTLPAGKAWQEIAVTLPIHGEAEIIRLYLPAEKSAVEIQSLRFTDKTGHARAWDFSGVKP
jgi:hypothetical protein